MNEVELLRAMTPGSWGVWSLVALAVLSLIKGWPVLKKIGMDGDASLRHDLLDEVRALRREVADERRSCDLKLAEQDKRHATELGELRGEINGLRNQLLQMQSMTGNPIPLSDLAAFADAAIKNREGGQ